MIPRILFICIAAFWVAMNVLLWRVEYGARGGGMPVPVDLVWKKILTAPDASLLSVYEKGQKTGFCELSTSVEQAMAGLDADNPPPEGLVARAGWQIRVDGNVNLGDFTNRLRFDARIQFFPGRAWRELNLKLSTRFAAVEIHSAATNRNVRLKITSDGETTEHDFSFADLQNPDILLHAFAGNFDGGFLDGLTLPFLPQTPAAPAQNIHWEAHRDRLMIGREPVSVYRLETRVLQKPVVIYVSTLGEILRVELPGDIIATLDELNKS